MFTSLQMRAADKPGSISPISFWLSDYTQFYLSKEIFLNLQLLFVTVKPQKNERVRSSEFGVRRVGSGSYSNSKHVEKSSGSTQLESRALISSLPSGPLNVREVCERKSIF